MLHCDVALMINSDGIIGSTDGFIDPGSQVLQQQVCRRFALSSGEPLCLDWRTVSFVQGLCCRR